MPVLVAVQDAEMRSALCVLLEDAGCEVIAPNRRLNAVALLARSVSPIVVLLDTVLGDLATAEQIFSLTRAGRPWVCHAYIALCTVDPLRWSPRLAELSVAEGMPVLHLPRALDWLVPAVSAAETAPREECGCEELSA
jgi:hypothetical protein